MPVIMNKVQQSRNKIRLTKNDVALGN